MNKPVPPSSETRDKIDSDVESFLKSGGKITKIDRGVSGYQQSKHIVINPARKTAAVLNSKASNE
jgi:hypothetical protein